MVLILRDLTISHATLGYLVVGATGVAVAWRRVRLDVDGRTNGGGSINSWAGGVNESRALCRNSEEVENQLEVQGISLEEGAKEVNKKRTRIVRVSDEFEGGGAWR